MMFRKINSKHVQINFEKTIRDAMKKLNSIEERFLLVTNNKDKLLGTVTDGDIRRALLKGAEINLSVTNCMNSKPIISKEIFKNYSYLFNKMQSDIKFLPIVDNYKKVKFVLLENTKKHYRTALILAGGFGKRLGSITKNTPKPLLKIKSKPILEIILRKLEKANYKKIHIATHYLHDKIEKYIKKRNSLADLNIIHEIKPMGTAGSIQKLKEEIFESLTVLNGDVISEINLDALNQFHLQKKYDLTLTVACYDYSIPFGVVEFDKNFKFKSLIEKPLKKYFILSGIYCLSKRACALATKKYLDMPDLIEQAKSLGYNIGIFPIYEYWNDIGSSKALMNEKIRK